VPGRGPTSPRSPTNSTVASGPIGAICQPSGSLKFLSKLHLYGGFPTVLSLPIHSFEPFSEQPRTFKRTLRLEHSTITRPIARLNRAKVTTGIHCGGGHIDLALFILVLSALVYSPAGLHFNSHFDLLLAASTAAPRE
jgi:hypothetical protein